MKAYGPTGISYYCTKQSFIETLRANGKVRIVQVLDGNEFCTIGEFFANTDSELEALYNNVKTMGYNTSDKLLEVELQVTS